MSIFKSTFSPFIKAQLDVRQEAISIRTPMNMQYYNSRNAWIRMSSSVNVNNSADLAKSYILQGGTLTKNKQLKSGLGDFSNAYSNTAYDGTPYRLGIRPMPGITSLDIKSKSAYGSLREAVVNFQCWDIKQLEDLELLYMRPGYTVLIEWGWAPYIDNRGNYNSTFTDYYDILDKPPTKRTTLFKDLYKKSIEHSGNYDAMFGYIKNYQWSARMDGGYDCQVSVISTGELIESLKVNYLNIDAINESNPGKLSSEFISSYQGEFNAYKEAYNKNILAGIWAETHHKLLANEYENTATVPNNSVFNRKNIILPKLKLSSPNQQKNDLRGDSGQVYITLQSMIDVLNKYVIAKGSDKESLIRLSLNSTKYDGDSIDEEDDNDSTTTTVTPSRINTLPGQASTITDARATPNQTTEASKTNSNKDLLCVAHPLQISVDPSICIIKSPYWGRGEFVSQVSEKIQEKNIDVSSEAKSIVDALLEASVGSGTNKFELFAALERIKTADIYIYVKQILKDKGQTDKETYGDYDTLEKLLNEEVGALTDARRMIPAVINFRNFGVTLKYNSNFSGGVENNSIKIIEESLPSSSEATATQANISENASKVGDAISQIAFLPTQQFFYENEYSEIGIIKNIFVNVKFLYEQALDSSLQGADPKEKNEINLYSYLKKIMNAIQAAIGNVNNFEIHVDPVDNNVARIIDVNYTEHPKSKYEDLFPLKIQTLGSVVRSYNLQSQIFPEQSSIVAIGAQAKGGPLGVQSNTMIDFNRNITDRILTKKTDAQESEVTASRTENDKYATNITNALSDILTLFSSLTSTSADNSNSNSSDYSTIASNAKNALRDLIVYFQSVTKSPGSNRNLIPTKFSCEMDGIGGLVIGHMFRLPENVMPRGYRGEGGVGVQLGNAITGIGHSISNGDWVTKIDSLNIVMNDPQGEIRFQDLDTKAIIGREIDGGGGAPPPNTGGGVGMGGGGGTTKVINGKTYKNGEVDELLVNIRQDLYNRHYSSVNQSDNTRIRLQAAAMQNLERMLTDAYTAGIYLKVNSAYRTYEDQVRIANSKSGIKAATPGTSNHGFGLAVDLANRNGTRINITGFSGKKPIDKTIAEWNWLQTNQQKYNFKNIDDEGESHHYNFIG